MSWPLKHIDILTFTEINCDVSTNHDGIPFEYPHRRRTTQSIASDALSNYLHSSQNFSHISNRFFDFHSKFSQKKKEA